MSKHRNDLVKGSILPSTWVNAIMEFLGSMASDNFKLTFTATSVTLSAAAGDGQIALAIGGRWRYMAAPVTVNHPGGAAGIYDVFATATDNDFGAGDNPIDATNYGFGLAILATGAVPGAGLFRKVGACRWNGTAIIDLRHHVGRHAGAEIPIGGMIPYAGQSDPADSRFLLAEGRLIDRTVNASFFAVCGHAYNGGVDPGSNMVRIPDKRGRGSIGPDNMGTAQGAASRVTTAASHPNARGQNGGAERHSLLAAESGVNSNATMSDPGNHSHGVHVGEANNSGITSNFPDLPVVPNNRIGDLFAQFDAYTDSTGAGGHGHSLTARSADSAHNNMHPYEVDNWLVRVG